VNDRRDDAPHTDALTRHSDGAHPFPAWRSRGALPAVVASVTGAIDAEFSVVRLGFGFFVGLAVDCLGGTAIDIGFGIAIDIARILAVRVASVGLSERVGRHNAVVLERGVIERRVVSVLANNAQCGVQRLSVGRLSGVGRPDAQPERRRPVRHAVGLEPPGGRLADRLDERVLRVVEEVHVVGLRDQVRVAGDRYVDQEVGVAVAHRSRCSSIASAVDGPISWISSSRSRSARCSSSSDSNSAASVRAVFGPIPRLIA